MHDQIHKKTTAKASIMSARAQLSTPFLAAGSDYTFLRDSYHVRKDVVVGCGKALWYRGGHDIARYTYIDRYIERSY